MTQTAFERQSTYLPGGERLEAVLAAAAPFPERLAADHFEPAPTPEEELSERVARWLEQAAVDRETPELRRGLGNVRLRDPRRLPDWARALVVFLEAQPETAEEDHASTTPGGLVEACARAAERLLETRSTTARMELAGGARDDLARMLAVRLSYALGPAMEFELRLHGSESLDPAAVPMDMSREGWLERLETLPGLAYVLGVACRQWRDATAELLRRLYDDLPVLRERLWRGEHPGALVSISGDAGDRHNDGRAVALLEFASGRGVVYKPKRLEHTQAFMDVVDFLNARGLPLELQTREVILRGEYGWEERVAAAPCADRSGFARYYRRLGMLVRLAQLLEGRDLWADNLLAAGEHPVLTDLECLLYPRVTPPPALPRERADLLELFEETVVRTGMVVQSWVPRPSLPVCDMGCLSRAGDVMSEGRALPLPPYRPWHGDETADPWRYGEEVVVGYCEMQAALAAAQTELQAPDGPLARLRGAEVRYIWRHTWDCQRVVRATTRPHALVDGAAREVVLARVLRDAHAALAGDPTRSDLVAIAAAEVDAFRQLDIPLFLSTTDSTRPSTPDGKVLPDHFRGTAWGRLQKRVDGLHAFPTGEHVAVITACLDAARSGGEVPARRRRQPLPLAGGPLEIAAQLADTILAARRRVGDRTGWLGLSWYPVPDLHQVEVTGSDLLTGTGAIAIFLAELASRTGEERYRAAAVDALQDSRDLVGNAFAFVSEVRLAGGAAVPGGFAGPGAVLYALARSAPLVGDPSLLESARTLVGPAAGIARSGAACADAPFGTAGLLLQALRLRALLPGAELDELVRELAADAFATLADDAPRFAPYAPASRLPELAPVGRDSVAVALARTVAEAPELVGDLPSARSALGAHRYRLGRRGGRLASLDAARSLGVEPDPNAFVTVAGLRGLGSREVLAAAGEALVAGDHDRAQLLFGELAERRRTLGGWFADRWIDDSLNLSAVDGLVAVGLLALGLADADLPSLTLLR
jgi:class II lanthipeptide synthase